MAKSPLSTGPASAVVPCREDFPFGRRHGGIVIFGVVFGTAALITRLVLMLKAWSQLEPGWSLLVAFGWGMVYDLGTAAWLALPLILLLTLLPADWGAGRWQRLLTYGGGFLLLTGLVFGAMAEWLFWEEFGVRFNFIAVDYLVYTTEVIGNIRESYNLPLVSGAVLVLAGAGSALVYATGWPRRWLASAGAPAGVRWRAGVAWGAAALALGVTLDQDQLPPFANNYHRELARNGLWSLFAAFRDNALDYDQFYRTMPPGETFARLREELVEDGSLPLTSGATDTLRYVRTAGPELRPNIIQITVESLSAEFLGTFRPGSTLTPRLDALAAQSLVFANLFATGTRTDRGMEALSLSLPPTPGRSLIKRPRNEDLFTLGSVLRTRGYDTAFLYGGFGYFDNMNHFFGRNGYRIVDRNSVPRSDITFANAWGACDEDLYRWVLREADSAHAAGRPFHHFVMTTSNHRPFTYPEGRIDLPPKVSGRDGAVKYTDFAIGQFLDAAAKKPWYRDTVFVIVADHCASSAGRAELPIQNYHIPLLVFAPGGQVAPGRVRTLMSQMDYAPTLLGLLNWSYASRFFGHDVRRIPDEDAHALIGNYQKLGHLEKNELVVLQPRRGVTAYRVGDDGRTTAPISGSNYAVREAVSFYGAASYLYRHGLYRALSPAQVRRYVAEGEALASVGSSGGQAAAQP